MSARRRHDFGPHGESGSDGTDRGFAHQSIDPAIQRDLDEARREFAKAKAASDEAKAAKEDLERLRVELRDERIKAAKEEVARLRASNDALSREADEERARAVAAKAAELEARERAVRDAEERSEKVRAAAEALEAAELRRRLAEDEASRLRKTTPEREKGSDIAFAELKVLAETSARAVLAERDSARLSNPGERRSGGVDDGERRFDAAVTAVTAASSERDAPGAGERVATRDADIAKESTVVPAAPPPVTQAAAGEGLVLEEKKRREEEVFTGTIVKPFAATSIARHGRKDDEAVRGDDMEGEMIVKEDVEHRPPPVTLGPGSAGASAVRRVPSHPRMNPALSPKPPSPGASPAGGGTLGPRHASPPGGTPRSPRWDAVAAAVAARSSSTPGSGSNPALTPGSSRYYRERVGLGPAGPAVTTPPSGGSSPGGARGRTPPSSNPRRAGSNPRRSPGAGSPDSADISRAMRTDPNLNPGARDDDDSRQFSVSDISGDVSVGKSP